MELDYETLRSLGYIVSMPDFYIDRIVSIDSLDLLISAMMEKLDAGGSIRGIKQIELKGGNAVNLAYALARFGVKSVLITSADDYGREILRDAFDDLNAELIIKDGKQGYTVSFEIRDRANIMISDNGTNEMFGLDMISSDDANMIRDAIAIAITNWASNAKGNELVEGVFSLAENSLHFLDPADISARSDEFLAMINRLGHLIDILSINENEARILAERLNISADLDDMAYRLAKELNVRIDLHTSSLAATSNGADNTIVKTFAINARILTGAGDVWDAADLIGYIANLSEHDRLYLANAAAALYVSNASPPTLNEVMNFMDRVRDH